MQIATRTADVRAHVSSWRARAERVVLVPTMGNLHAGHLSLLETGRTHGARVVASIFVNPTQFGPNEDFARYPRTLEEDTGRLDAARCDLLFQPDVDEMYPNGTESATRVEVPGLSSILCGEFRPGHFTGVATVVAKLFHIVDPDVAIFGEKDYQQLLVIRRMVADLCMRVDVVGAPTVREADGLALSSRNQYLSAEDRRTAPALYRQLTRSAQDIGTGDLDFARIGAMGRAALDAAGFRTDYFSVRAADSLDEPRPDTRQLVVLAAARLGTTRLIDNVRIRREPAA